MPGFSTDQGDRPGEVALGFDPADRQDGTLCFIGHIRSSWAKGTAPKNMRAARETGKAAEIVLRPEFAGGLAGLQLGQAIQVLYWVDRGERDLIVQTPRHAPEPRGVFSLRSPVRPNPIALGTAVITALNENILGIDATDAWDGTPVLDIKPWISTVDVPPDWHPEG